MLETGLGGSCLYAGDPQNEYIGPQIERAKN